jgi:hypothetical protein
LLIDIKDVYGLGNIIKLSLKHLDSWSSLKLSEIAILNIFENSVFPFYFESQSKPLERLFERIMDTVRQLMISFKAAHLQEKLSAVFGRVYRSFWTDCQPDYQSTLDVGLLERQLTLMELIHYSSPYPSELANSGMLKKHIKALLMFRG